jgi:hypothetical protein
VVDARLVYTTNGSQLLQHKRQEEWFDVPAEIKDGVVSVAAPPGMTHGIFYLRDENGFLILSEPLAPYAGKGASNAVGVDLIQDGYAWRPGLLSLIKLAVAAEDHAKKTGQDAAALNGAIQSARVVAANPVEEESCALSMRALRKAIKSLNVPQAKLPVMNQFATEKW